MVRDDDGASDLLFQTSDTTWQAYNAYGGNSLYTGQPAGRAYKVSYNRPFTTRGNAPEDWVFNSEYPMVRFLESNGYDVSYSTGVDTDRRGAELLEHEAFLSVGHDEYWSGAQRANVEAARAAGVDLAFFSGNEVFWKTRWENSIDGSGTAYRTLVTYKETHADAKIDPLPNVWTGTWRDPRFSPPADGNRPENALSGQIFTINCCAINMVVGQADGRMRFWRNTRVATLATNATTTIGSNVIGYEWDEDLDNGSRPPGSFRVSQTSGTGDRITDYGTNYAQGAATHSMTLYKHASGALVFGAGTIQWAWALDSEHDRGSAAADTAAQQATVNLFADMGVQPTTLRPGLVAATASTDTTGADVRHHLTGRGRHRPGRRAADRHRHRRRHRRRGSAASRSRPTTAPPGGGPPAASAGATPSPRRQPAASPCAAGPPTTAPTSRRRPPASQSTSAPRPPPARARSGRAPRHRPRRPRHQPGRARREVPHQHRRLHHRHPLLQARTSNGTHVGSLWSATGTRLATSPSPTRPPPAGSRSASPRRSR